MRRDDPPVREVRDIDGRQMVSRDVDDLGVALDRQVPDLDRGDPTSPVRTRSRRARTPRTAPTGSAARRETLQLLDLDGPPGPVHLELPHARRSVAPAGDDASGIGRPVHRDHDAGVSEQLALEAAGRRLPDAHRGVARGRGDPSAVRAPRDGVDGVGVPSELEEEVAGSRTSNTDASRRPPLATASRLPSGLRAVSNTNASRSLDRAHDLARRRLGHSGPVLVRPRGRDERPSASERLPHDAGRPRTLAAARRSRRIPDLQEPVVAGRREHRAVGREPRRR